MPTPRIGTAAAGSADPARGNHVQNKKPDITCKNFMRRLLNHINTDFYFLILAL